MPFGKLGDAVANQLLDLAGGLQPLQPEGFGRAHDALAMEVEIGGDAFEGAGAIEHAGTEPGRVGHRAHDLRIAFVPVAPSNQVQAWACASLYAIISLPLRRTD